MGEIFLGVVIIFIVVAVTLILFGGWVLVNISRGLASLLGLNHRVPPRVHQRSASHGGPSREVLQCRVPGCRHPNPAGARFCRHCGHAFPAFQIAA
jgi:hypothetical protein